MWVHGRRNLKGSRDVAARVCWQCSGPPTNLPIGRGCCASVGITPGRRHSGVAVYVPSSTHT
eukprot:8927364-Pyramimonas_sp.AAC.1